MFSQGDFNSWMGRKYDILGQHAGADVTRANAEAGLQNAQAGEVSPNAAALRALQAQEGGKLGAETNLTNAQVPEVAPTAAANRFETYGRGNLSNAGAAEGFHNAAPMSDAMGGVLQQLQNQSFNPMGTRPPPTPGLGPLNAPNPEAGFDIGHARGTANISTAHDPQRGASIMAASSYAGGGMVPGQSNPAVTGTHASDQIPALLAPREAVLNEHGADLIGREKIAAANAIGNHLAAAGRQQAGPPAGPAKGGKGMIQPKGKTGPGVPTGHAEGSSMIGDIGNAVSNWWHGSSTPAADALNSVSPQGQMMGGFSGAMNSAMKSATGQDMAGRDPDPMNASNPDGTAKYSAGTSMVQPQNNIAKQSPAGTHTAPALKQPAHYAGGSSFVQPQDKVAKQPKEISHKAPALKGPKPQDFAKGSHMVGHGSSAKTPTKIDPAAMVSLMQAMHQPGEAGPGGAPGPMMGGGQMAGLCRGGMV